MRRAGLGGPFTTATTITGTTQPSGIVGGFCYLYTLTGTDNVGNNASISTTVKVDTGPTLTSGTIVNAKTSLSGVVDAADNFTVYANVADGGTGITTVTVDIFVPDDAQPRPRDPIRTAAPARTSAA